MSKKKTPEPVKKPAPVKNPLAQIPECDIHYYKDPKIGTEKQELGIVYDWKRIDEAYKALDCPEGWYDPTTAPVDATYLVLCSGRSTGKTTNVLLRFMCAAWIYRGAMVYLRQHEYMIEPRQINTLFEVIRGCGYIPKITGGQYNDVEYWARAWRYVNRDEYGKVVDRSDPFCYCLAIDRGGTYKSVFNCPRADFMLYDEFISTDYFKNEFTLGFLDLCRTVFRDRLSPTNITLCANTTNPWSEYLRELGVQGVISHLTEGEHSEITTSKGTRVYCEFIGHKSEARKVLNSKYYGFDSPMIQSITGGAGWNVACYPHIDDTERKPVFRGIYLKFESYIVELEVVQSKEIGVHMLAHKATKVNDKAAVVYTLNEITEAREAFCFGNRRPIDKLVWSLYERNLVFYANNEVGSVVESFYSRARKM